MTFEEVYEKTYQVILVFAALIILNTQWRNYSFDVTTTHTKKLVMNKVLFLLVIFKLKKKEPISCVLRYEVQMTHKKFIYFFFYSSF